MRGVFSVLVSGVLAMAALSGCGGTAVKPDRLASIQSFSVDGDVKVAEKPIYFGPETAWAGILAGIPGAVVAAVAIPYPQRIKDYLAAQNISVGTICRDEFLRQLAAEPSFAGKISDTGKAHFQLEVFNYGLFQNGGFSSEYKTVLYVRAQLIDAETRIMWQSITTPYRPGRSRPIFPTLPIFGRASRSPRNR
jgi:hypothetical protein